MAHSSRTSLDLAERRAALRRMALPLAIAVMVGSLLASAVLLVSMANR